MSSTAEFAASTTPRACASLVAEFAAHPLFGVLILELEGVVCIRLIGAGCASQVG
jgi:hypothetical protein